MAYEFDWVDAFSSQPFGGNGCAVVYNAEAISSEVAQAVVRETGLVECTFLQPSSKADIKIRYFMADREIPFAGHPTLASVASLVDRDILKPGMITVETGAGVLDVQIEDRPSGVPNITMTQKRPEFGPEVDAALVAAVGGLSADDVFGEPRVVSTGLPFCITVLQSKDALRRAKMDLQALQTFRLAAGGELADVMEPFWVCLEGETGSGHTFSRLLLAPPLPPEDPFTGSATGAMAAYLWGSGYLNERRFVAEQGHWMGRPGQARVEVLGQRDNIEGVRVGGTGYILMRGFLNL